MFSYRPNIYTGKLPQPAVDAAIAHAISESPEIESCGAVIKGKYVPFENVACEDRVDSFEIADLYWFLSYMNDDVDCIVHSHQNYNKATPYDLQRQQALDIPSLIINLKDRRLQDCILFGEEDRPPLMGRPFFYGAFDCLTLTSDHLQETLGIVLPNPPREWEFWANAENIFESAISENTEVPIKEVGLDDMEINDILLYNINGTKYANHIAVLYNTDFEVLHHFHRGISGKFPLSYHRSYLQKVYRLIL